MKFSYIISILASSMYFTAFPAAANWAGICKIDSICEAHVCASSAGGLRQACRNSKCGPNGQIVNAYTSNCTPNSVTFEWISPDFDKALKAFEEYEKQFNIQPAEDQ